MSKHFLNTCPICGDVSKCRCSHCKRVHTSNVCARCSEETTADYTDTAPSPAGDTETSFRVHKPLPYDMVQFDLPFLMHKLGFNYLASALKKVKGSGGANWDTFLDPVTKRHIVKKGRLPGKEESSTDEASLDHIRGDDQSDEKILQDYLEKLEKAYKDRKKTLKI